MIASSLLVALLAGFLTLPATAGAIAAPYSAPSDKSSALSAAEEQSAALLAVETDRPVIVDSETTPTTLVRAMPDGSMELRSDTFPVRVDTGSGWADVDTTLASDGNGSWVPKMSASPVEFSDGGAGYLARVQADDGSWISTVWPHGALAKPIIDGATATYAEALPGVDIVLTATASGMSEVLVVKSAAAGANPLLSPLSIPIEGAEVVVDDNGTATATAPSGATLLSSTPLWWDSARAGSDETAPDPRAPITPVDREAEDGDLEIEIAEVASTPGVVFPLYIDPDWSVGSQASWYTDQAFPNQSYLNASTSAVLRIGYSSPNRGRAFWEFNTAPIAGKTVLSAQFSAVQRQTFTCTTNNVQLYRYGPAGAGFTWNGDPGAYAQLLDTQNIAFGNSCRGASVVGFNATGGAQWAAGASSGVLQLSLRVADETNSTTRSHWDRGGTLFVTYNSPPNTPTELSMISPPRGCGTLSSPDFVNSGQPITVRVRQTDPDGGNVATNFWLRNEPGTAAVQQYGTPLQAQGYITWPIGTGLPPGKYKWQARGSDYIVDGAAFTPYCYFNVDNTPPPLPTIAFGSEPKVTGKPVSVTFGTSTTDGVAGIAYWWGSADDVPVIGASGISPQQLPACGSGAGIVRYACVTRNSATTVATVAPVDAGPSVTLHAVAYDLAGNIDTTGSASASIAVGADANARPSSSTGHGWSTTADPTSATLADSTTGTSLPLTLGTQLQAKRALLADPDHAGALPLLGLTTLTRSNGPGGHDVVLEGSFAAGRYAETPLGSITANQLNPPSDTVPLYRCKMPVGWSLSLASGCDGGTNLEQLGYIWTTASGAGPDATPVYRCIVTGSTEAFISPSAGCEGQQFGALLGYSSSTPTVVSAASAVNTISSFAAGAWLRPSSNITGAHPYTALAQSGSVDSGFTLQLTTDKYWQFCVRTQTAPRTVACAKSPTAAAMNQWAYVLGIWDAVNGQVRLVVTTGNSTVQPTSVTSFMRPAGDVTAAGSVTLGAGISNSSPVDQWHGRIAGPAVVAGVPSSTQLFELQNLG